MKTARIITFYLVAMMLTCIKASGQVSVSAPFELKGQVVDSLTNEPVSFATLRISSSPNAKEAQVLLACDIEGNFMASLPKAGIYYIHMSSIGKVPGQEKIEFPTGVSRWNVGKLYLADDAKSLSEVTVSAQKLLVKADLDKIVYSLDEEPEAKVSSTLEMLRRVPMVTVDGDDNIQLKGSGNFKIYMNGRPSGLLSNNPSVVLKSLPASSVKSIEVITDPGARYDAEGVSGIINIIMVKRALDGYTGTVNLEASNNPTYGTGAFVSLKTGKLGLTANYNFEYEREPVADTESMRENLKSDDNRYLNQVGTHWEKERMHRGYLEGTFEIDSLNLISVDANLFRKRQREYTDLGVEMLGINRDLIYSYNRFSENYPLFGSMEINANYQHESRRKGEMLTLSYRFTNDPSDDENQTRITGLTNFANIFQWDKNKAKTNEHTAQLDYVRPVIAGHELETGVKYILRQTDSDISQFIFNESGGIWEEIPDSRVDFTHTQHIYSAYLGDSFRWKSWGAKAGIRAEGTRLAVRYAYEPSKDFKTNFLDVVPNVTFSYALGQSQQLRIGYNMRIRRAGIDFLNPYINKTDPLNISYGNPDLSSEKSNSVNFNYTLFTQKFNLNVGLSHTFVNNSIEQYTLLDPQNSNVTVSTYGNIGKRKQTGLSLYLNWSPVSLFRFFMNGGLNYTDLEAEQNGLSNSGLSGRFFAGMQFSFPKDFRINVNAGYFLPEVQLQGKRSAFMFNGITLNKDFFNKKLTVSVSCKSPFQRTWAIRDELYNESFVLRSVEHKVMREFGITLAYRFGSLSDSMKKIKRGIVNDDVKESGNNGGF